MMDGKNIWLISYTWQQEKLEVNCQSKFEVFHWFCALADFTPNKLEAYVQTQKYNKFDYLFLKSKLSIW